MSQNSSLDNVPGAKHGIADSLAAPGCAGAGGTNEPRNKAAWLSVSDFLARQNLHRVLARQRSVAASVAGAAQAASAAQGASRSIPVGNHGEIVAKGAGV